MMPKDDILKRMMPPNATVAAVADAVVNAANATVAATGGFVLEDEAAAAQQKGRTALGLCEATCDAEGHAKCRWSG